MLQAIVLQVVATWEDELTLLAIDLVLGALFIVMAPNLLISRQIFGTVRAEMVCQLVLVIGVIRHFLLAFWALYLKA